MKTTTSVTTESCKNCGFEFVLSEDNEDESRPPTDKLGMCTNCGYCYHVDIKTGNQRDATIEDLEFLAIHHNGMFREVMRYMASIRKEKMLYIRVPLDDYQKELLLLVLKYS